MTYDFHLDLSSDFSQLLETEIDYNVIIQVGKDSNASNTKFPGQEKHPNASNAKVPGQEKPTSMQIMQKPEKLKSTLVPEKSPETKESEIEEPETNESEIKEPETKESEIVKEPETNELEIKEPETNESETKEPETKELEIKEPETEAKEPKPVTFMEFHVHSNILRIRSEYFNKIFVNNEVKKNNNGIYYINKPNITPQASEFVLR
jgi:hypothetical protein